MINKEEASYLQAVIGQKLNPIKGIPSSQVHKDAKLHYQIGLYVPQAFILKALRSTTNAYLRKLRSGKKMNNPDTYFLAAIRGVCRDNDIEYPSQR